MAANAKTKGLKRICTGCGTRYYDLNKRPVICPSCKIEFVAEQKAKTRRVRAPANDDDTVKAKPVEPETEIVERDEELISLEEVETMDDGDDVEIDDDLGDLDEELEEEEPAAPEKE